MFCFKCGKEINNSDEYCPDCGVSQAPPTPFPQPAKKSYLWLWITLPAVLVIIAAVITVFFLFFRNLAPILTVGRALSNLGAEVEERIDGSPFKAFLMLPEVLEDGTLTANFGYSYSLFGSWLTADVDGSIRLLSNTKEREFALGAQIGTFGESVDFDIYLNRERLALQFGLFDNNYYGIRYDTFRDDIRAFGGLIGLDDETMENLADLVDGLNEAINNDDAETDLVKAYRDVFIDSAKNLKITETRSHMESTGERVSCKLVEITISKENILEFLNAFYDVVEDNDTLRSQYSLFDNPLFSGGYGNSYQQYLREFRSTIRDIERNFSGEIKLAFFIGAGDRLLQSVISANTVYYGSNSEFTATFKFGNSKTDDWDFILSYTDDYTDELMTAKWSYEELSGRYVNTLQIVNTDMDFVIFKSEWDTGNGDFILIFDDGRDKNELEGVFIPGGKNFRLAMDSILPDDSDGKLKIELTAETGTQIDEIDFINIDRWGNAFIDSILRFILGSVFS